MQLKDAGIYDFVNIFKGKATDAHNASQGSVINNSPRLINIPAYQRPYRWDETNINRLFLDYNDSNSEYFLGATVAVEQHKNETEDLIEFDIVDGQQRITTLYLLNYIRFLLLREYVLEKISRPSQLRASEYCTKLKECYVDLIGKNETPFNNILATINELTDAEEIIDAEDRVNKLISCYVEELKIPQVTNNVALTFEARLSKAKEFFQNEKLCLKYSRRKYNNVLRDALSIVYLEPDQNTNNFKLSVIPNTQEGKDQYIKPYLTALETIFNNAWNYAVQHVDNPNIAKRIDICDKAIHFLDNMIDNMSICIVITEHEHDATKLFEVLNDRSLDVTDLELIKNHFFKEYCMRSGDEEKDPQTVDKNFSALDELWNDKIFVGEGSKEDEKRNKHVSYCAAVYLTARQEIENDLRIEDEYKSAIEDDYSKIIESYSYNDILRDFYIYYAIRIIFDEFESSFRNSSACALKAEQDKTKSITYKTFHLLNALKYSGVLVALINVIVSTYEHTFDNYFEKSLEDFETSFRDYIRTIINDNEHKKFRIVHKNAFTLWVASMMGKDYKKPRSIAKEIIKKYGRNMYANNENELDLILGGVQTSFKDEFSKWLGDWKYNKNGNHDLIVKILFLKLLLSDRKPIDSDYNSDTITLNLNTKFEYTRDADKLHLDHLEAKNPDDYQEFYYSYDNLEKRRTDINNYLGNFMILDQPDNIEKSNAPLYKALKYYEDIRKSWLVEDIANMINDEAYFNHDKKIPKEDFFIFRSTQLKQYFAALLNRGFEQNEIEVKLK